MANIKEPSSATTSGEVIATNYDLATQILLHLPATSVVNLKITSKLWCLISSDHYFITNHTVSHPPLLSGLFLHYLGRARASSHEYATLQPINRSKYTPLQFVGALNSLDLHILQSCNGLLLCSSNTNGYYICNPTTLQRRLIPLPKEWLVFGPLALNLAFDPRKSPYYKVVRVKRLYGKQPNYQVEVYSSETGQWKVSGEAFVEAQEVNFKQGVYCKGAIHWLKPTSSCLYFDIDNECIKVTPEPPRAKQFDVSERDYFGQSNGCLYLVVRRHLPNFTLFQMEDDYSGWFMKYFVDLDVLASSFPSMARNFYNTPIFCRFYECNVLCVVDNNTGKGNNENGQLNLVVSIPGEIVYFNPCTNVSNKIAQLMVCPFDESVWFRDFFVHEYVETICAV
ncbi:hypothetical protein RDABS01_017092 [Bienertia sinuspersici]